MLPDQIYWIAGFLCFVMVVILSAYIASGILQQPSSCEDTSCLSPSACSSSISNSSPSSCETPLIPSC